MGEHENVPVKNATRYDLNKYWGRVRYFADVTDMRTLFTSKKQLEEAKALIEKYEKGQVQLGVDVAMNEIWKAKKICNAMIHPDTGEVIPAPFRFSAFLPANLFIVAGMLTARTVSLFAEIFLTVML